MKHSRRSCMTLLWLLLLVSVPSDRIHGETSEWNLGLVLCLSGPCAPDGDFALKGVQLAVDEINKHGGVLGKQIRIHSEDTNEATSGAKAVGAFKKLRLNKDIHFFIGPSWTPGGLSLSPIVSKESDVIITSPSLGVREFHEAGDNIFNSRGTDEVTTQKAAQMAIKKGYKTAAIFSSQQPWEQLQGKYFKEEFERLGGKIVAMVEPLPTITNLSTEATKISSSKPDVIFFTQVVQLATAAKEMTKLGYKGPKIGAYIDGARIAEAQGSLEGAIFYTYQKPTDEYVKKFKEKYNKIPEIPAATGYDTVYAYATAIKSVGSFEVEKVKKAIPNIHFDGASGTVYFNGNRSVSKDPTLWQVTGTGYASLSQ